MANWQPTKSTRICCQHFAASDFVKRYDILDGASNNLLKKLRVDDIGIAVWPKVFEEPMRESACMSPNSRRKSVQEILDASRESDRGERDESTETLQEMDSRGTRFTKDSFIQTEPETNKCNQCQEITRKMRVLNNKLVELEAKEREYQRVIQHLQKDLSLKPEEERNESDDEIDVDSEDEMESMNVSYTSIEVEPGAESGSEFFPTPKKCKIQTDTDDEEETEYKSKLTSTSDNLRVEPKFIVFLSQLLLLFKFCPVCKCEAPLVETEALGTMATVRTFCSNPKCPNRDNTWNSQPIMPGTKMPAGNFLLCFAILVAGSTASKVLQMFSHMGICCFSLKTYFLHQRKKLFPAIYLHWKKYQKELLDKLVEKKDPVVIGDARHDSMGHSAKYGAYTIYCCCSAAIIHFALVQRNQAGNSPAMEYMGFQQCMEFLLGIGLVIGTVITDRHTSIAKHMRERLPDIKHYFDLWHIKKKIGKVLNKFAKLSGCEAVKAWIRPCENHFYWSVTSTISGNGRLIWAKFHSFLSHIIDKHKELPDPLFTKCHHEEIEPRQWLLPDSMVYDKLRTALTKPSLVSGIKQASPISQTSCLEGFHSVINHFAPKMIAFSYSGMLVRHILASIHFNYNVQRDVKTKDDDSEQVSIVYPKFKNGEATVRSVRVKQNFEYVEEIYKTCLEAMVNNNLRDAVEELEMLTPEPMNTMLDKQDRDEAIRKRRARKQMVAVDVPGTAEENENITDEVIERPAARKKPQCTVCGQPMKGHKNVVNCPKNQNN